MLLVRTIYVIMIAMTVVSCDGAPGDDYLSYQEAKAYLCLYSLSFKQENRVSRECRSMARNKVEIPDKGMSTKAIRASYDYALTEVQKQQKSSQKSPGLYNASYAEFTEISEFIWLTRLTQACEPGWKKEAYDTLIKGYWMDHALANNTVTYETFMDIMGNLAQFFDFHYDDDDEGGNDEEGCSGSSSRSNSEDTDFSMLLTWDEARYYLTAYSLECDGDMPSWWRGAVCRQVDISECLRREDVARCYDKQRALLEPVREIKALHTYVTRQEAKESMRARYGNRENKDDIDTSFAWYWEEYASNKLALSPDEFAKMNKIFDQSFAAKRTWSREKGDEQAEMLSDQMKRVALSGENDEEV